MSCKDTADVIVIGAGIAGAPVAAELLQGMAGFGLDAPPDWAEEMARKFLGRSLARQAFHPEAFEKPGIELAKRRYFCVKSSNHYLAGFAPIAAKVSPVATPGAITPDFSSIPYRNRARTYWPAIKDPVA